MTLATDLAALEAWKRRFVSGAARGGAPPSTTPPLTVLALAGQHERFQRPPAMAPAAGRAPMADPRPLLGEAARAPFRRLCRQKPGNVVGQMLMRAAFDRLAEAGLRPHPFDLPEAEPWLRQTPGRLGPAEHAYLEAAGQGGDAPSTSFSADWTEGAKAERLRYLQQQRLADPAAGRSLIEGRLPEEAAAVRVEMIRLLAQGLGPDDYPLLQALAADKAESVRGAARELLGRTPGAPDYDARVARLAEALTLKKVGLLGGRRRLEWRTPLKGKDQLATVEAAFVGLRLTDLAAALGVSVADLLGAAEEPMLALGLAHAALAEGRDGVLTALAKPLATYPVPFLVQHLAEPLAQAAPRLRARWVGQAIEASPPSVLYDIYSWSQMQAALEAPLPVSVISRLLGGPSWKSIVGAVRDGASPDPLAGLAALTSRGSARALLAALQAISPGAGPALDYAQFLTTLPPVADEETR